MHKLLPFLGCLMAAFWLISCQEDVINTNFIPVDGIYRVDYYDGNLKNIPAAGGQMQASIKITGDIAWNISSLPTWASLNKRQGNTSASLLFSISNNTSFSDRVAVYQLSTTFSGQTLRYERSLSQKAAEPYLMMTPTEAQLVEYDAHPFTLSIASNVLWQLECDQPDMVSFSKTSGVGSEDVTVTLAPFDVIDHTTTRTATITLSSRQSGFYSSQTLTIVQRSQGYREKVKQESIAFPWKVSNKSFSNLGNTQSFTTRTNAAWINISPSKGSGMLSPTIRVMPNASFTAREGFAYVDDSNGNTLYEFHVTQAGVECELSQDTLSFECNEKEFKSLSIKTNAQWTASTTSDWITIDNTTINEGTSQLSLSVSEWLSTSDRKALVTLSLVEDPALTRSFVVQQYGAYLMAKDELFEFMPEGGEKSYSFQGTSAWKTSCAQEWISVSPTSGKGANTLTIRVERNPLSTSRVGYVVLTDVANPTKEYTITIHQASTELAIDASELTFESKGGQKILQLSSNDAWIASVSDADWLKLAPNSGNGNVELAITASINKTAQARSAIVRLSANGQERTATIRQKESVIKTSVSKVSFFREGGSQSLTFECDELPTTTASVDWLTTDVSNNQLEINVEENNTEALRTGTIMLSLYEGAVTATITIEQLTNRAPNANGHEYVDLGLPSGLLWATCNVGASSAEEYGNYYAWGETSTKTTYDWSTYKWCNGSETTMTKYCIHTSYGNNGFTDGKTVLELSDDAARVNMGGDWRMPTKEEQDELRTKCTWTWTSLGGKNGYKVVGPNGNFIFLPAAGFRDGSSLYDAGSCGYYWSSTLLSNDCYYAYNLYFKSSNYDWRNNYRCYGRSVRGVLPSLAQ